MCGIVGYIGCKKAVPVLINGLLSLEYRGYDSAGIAVFNHNTIDVIKDKGRVKNLQENPLLKNIDSKIGIAHTRWATHGVPSKENAHPHVDNSKQFAVVHNGIIENYDELRKKLTENGYTLYSETDTEIIPNLIHFYYNKLENEDDIFIKAVSLALKDLVGSYAIEVLSPLFPNEIVVAKKDSPLVIGVGENENFIASDIPAVLSSTKKFYFLEDYELEIVEKNSINFYDIELKKIKKELKDIDWDAVSSEKNGYEDYMLKEIFEQSNAVRETIGTSLNSGIKVNLPLDNIDFSKFNKIYIVACGTAMHAGIATKYIFENYSKIPTEVDMASEFRYRNPLIDEKTLCIFISQSGETADTIAALKLAKNSGCTTIAIVNVVGSTITRIADYTLYTHAGPEIAVASTKAYTCQVTLLSILAIYIAEKISRCNSNDLENLKAEILELPNKLEITLQSSKISKDFASKIYMKKDIFFVGRNTDYAVSMEGSLKLKEISYIHSEAYAAGELKHGPIALIENGVTVIASATDEKTTPKTISNLEEVATRGANVILVTNQEINNSNFNNIIKIPECSSLISPVLSVIPLQLLAYYIAKNKNLDVDKPRNLAKSVTVE